MNLKQLDSFVPLKVSQKMNGKVYNKIRIKSEYVRSDGTSAIYLDLRIDKNRRKIPLDISIEPKRFNLKRQRINGSSKQVKDYNILIEKALSEISNIELSFRLSNKKLDLDTLLKEYYNPTPNYDFLKFYEYELERQEKFLKKGTYRQQKSCLNKLQAWKTHIPFSDINEQLINELKLYCKNVLKNENTTIATTLKNFKKYLHVANKKGIYTNLKFDDIKVAVHKGNRTYLDKTELRKLYEYYKNKYTNETHKLVLAKFLFSAFTSLRISDIQTITRENIIADFLVYKSSKTEKLNKIKLNESALKFIQPEGELFLDDFTPEYINRQLKIITSMVGIRKKVTFHVARHTFATNFISGGGNVVNLQHIMSHSNIRETMIYVHIVNRMLNDEISLLDNILF